MKKILLASLIILVGLGSCKKKERIPWEPQKYDNTFNENVRFIDISELDQIIAVDNSSAASRSGNESTFGTIDAPLGSVIASVEPGEIIFGMFGGTVFPNGTMRHVMGKDTINGNVKLLTQKAYFHHLMNGTYNLQQINFEDYFSSFSRVAPNGLFATYADSKSRSQAFQVSIPVKKGVDIDLKVFWDVNKEIQYNEIVDQVLWENNVSPGTIGYKKKVRVKRVTTEIGSEMTGYQATIRLTDPTQKLDEEVNFDLFNINMPTIKFGWFTIESKLTGKIEASRVEGRVDFVHTRSNDINRKSTDVLDAIIERKEDSYWNHTNSWGFPIGFKYQSVLDTTYGERIENLSKSEDLCQTSPVITNSFIAKARVYTNIILGFEAKVKILEGLLTLKFFPHAYLKLRLNGQIGTSNSDLLCELTTGVKITIDFIVADFGFINWIYNWEGWKIATLTYELIREFDVIAYLINQGNINPCSLRSMLNGATGCIIRPFTDKVVNAGYAGDVRVVIAKYDNSISEYVLMDEYIDQGGLAFIPQGSGTVHFDEFNNLNRPCSYSGSCSDFLFPAKYELYADAGQYIAIIKDVNGNLNLGSDPFIITNSDIGSCKPIECNNVGLNNGALVITGATSIDGCGVPVL